MSEKRLNRVRSFYKADRVMEGVLRAFSHVSAVCVVLMAVTATLNVIVQKIFHSNIASANDYVTYLFVTVIYAALPHVQMESDLTAVDILSKKFSRAVKGVLSVLGDVIGLACMGYLGWAMYTNVFTKYLASGKMATVGATGGFVLWPFALLIAVSALLTALTFLWNNVRRIVYRGPKYIPASLCQELGVQPPRKFGPPSADEESGGEK